jgi:multiple sugar transport system permease protein
MRKSPPDFLPTTPTFDGYARVLREQLPCFGTSLLVASGTVALTLVLAEISSMTGMSRERSGVAVPK